MNEFRKSKILAACLDAIESGDVEKKDRYLSRYPDLEGEMTTLISQAESLRNLPDFEMDETARRLRKMKLIARLPAHAEVVTKTHPFRLKGQKMEWRLTMTWIVIVAAIVSLMSGAGVVYASGDALPGEALYPVKMLMEDAQLALSPDLVDAELRIRFADHRISELVALLDEGRVEDAGLALSGYQNQTELLTRLFSRIEASNPEEALQLRTELQNKLQEQAVRMQAVVEGNGEMVRETVQTLLQTNTEMHSRLQLNGEPAGIGDSDEPGTLVPQEPVGAGSGSGQGNGQRSGEGQSEPIARNVILAGESLENGQLTLAFNGEEIEGQAYYLEVGGMRQDCTAGNGVITCTMNQVMQQGTANLYEKNTNTLLFQYKFDYSNQLQKGMTEGGNMGEDDKGGDQGQNGKK